MITKALVQVFDSDEHCHHEELLVVSELERRQIPFENFYRKELLRRKVTFGRQTLVVGEMDCTISALKYLGVDLPKPNDYPKSLRHQLHRNLRRSTLGKVEQMVMDGVTKPFFLKPAGRAKRFTGGLIEHHDDIYIRASGVSHREPVWIVDPVEWISEYRVYVIGREIQSVDFYDGDEDQEIELPIVEQAIDELHAADEALAAFTLDFGLLATGETALIEMNDAFSIGAYKIPAKEYTNLLMARWVQLVG
ncbi:MAG: ATP-grasp domain-containing protein [Verrucomicrobiota bacterium]